MRTTMLCVAGALAAVACGQRPPPPAPAAPAAVAAAATPSVRAQALDAAATGFEAVRGHWDDADGRSAWVGYFDRAELRLVEETIVRADAPPSHERYYYEHGALFYFSGSAPAVATGGAAAGSAPRVPARAEFRGAQTLSAVRIEHYGEVRLDAAAIDAIHRRAKLLASIATDSERATGGR